MIKLTKKMEDINMNYKGYIREIKLDENHNMIFHESNSQDMYENVSWRLNSFYTKEQETIEWIRTSVKPDSVFWDIGANIGQYGIFAASLHGCQTYLFEPEPLNFSTVTLNVKLNTLSKVLPVPIALSNKRGYNTINIKTEAGASNISIEHKAYQCKQGIWTDTIDLLVKEGFTHPTHLKIDVDGVEQKILEGAKETIPNLQSILIETDENSINKVATFLDQFGFKSFTAHKRGVPGIFNLIFSK